MRTAQIERKTAETEISLFLNLDGSGESEILSGVGFLDHMLTLFARHGSYDLKLSCRGDTWVDDHHSVEDVGICLGRAFSDALGDRRGVVRYGDITLPMDEALILAAVDLSGRGGCYYALEPPAQKVGSFDTELAEEFFIAFCRASGVTLHLRQLSGRNSHHILEGGFKAFARALSKATALDGKNADRIPSTKGMLV